MADPEGVDNLLLLLAQRSGGIDKLFESLFSFLARKTDFYNPPEKEADYLDHCAKLVACHCRNMGIKYADLIGKKYSSTQNSSSGSTGNSARPDGTNGGSSDGTEGDRVGTTSPGEPATNIADEVRKEVASSNNGDEMEVEEDEAPVGNGGKTEWYEWTQTLGSVEVSVRVPEGTVSRDLSVKISTTHLGVRLKGDLLFEGELFDMVKSDECLWALVDSRNLQISLEKRNQMSWWATVIRGHPEIDVKKIVPENSKLSDLDSETRSTVEKMMLEQRNKSLGLPSPAQARQYEALEKFKKAHPELDFSNANVNFS